MKHWLFTSCPNSSAVKQWQPGLSPQLKHGTNHSRFAFVGISSSLLQLGAHLSSFFSSHELFLEGICVSVDLSLWQPMHWVLLWLSNPCLVDQSLDFRTFRSTTQHVEQLLQPAVVLGHLMLLCKRTVARPMKCYRMSLAHRVNRIKDLGCPTVQLLKQFARAWGWCPWTSCLKNGERDLHTPRIQQYLSQQQYGCISPTFYGETLLGPTKLTSVWEHGSW